MPTYQFDRDAVFRDTGFIRELSDITSTVRLLVHCRECAAESTNRLVPAENVRFLIVGKSLLQMRSADTPMTSPLAFTRTDERGELEAQ